MSSHMTNIPEAVRIAASVDPSIDAGLKEEAVGYLQKVRELCEETWKVSGGVVLMVAWAVALAVVLYRTAEAASGQGHG